MHNRCIPEAIIEALLAPERAIQMEGLRQTAAAVQEDAPPGVIAALLNMMAIQDRRLEPPLVQALAACGKPVVPLLLARLDAGQMPACRIAIEALQQIASPTVIEEFIERIAYIDHPYQQQFPKRLARIGPVALPQLLAAADDPSPRVRDGVIMALALLRHPGGLAPLCAALESPNPMLRRLAVLAVGAIGDRDTLPQVIQRLNDPHETVRLSAIEALSRMALYDLTPVLIEALYDESRHVRVSAADALGESGDPDCVPALIELVAREQSSSVLYAAIKALEALGDVRAIPVLEARLNHRVRNPRNGRMVSEAAAKALRRLMSPPDVDDYPAGA